ncbi:MAG: carboxypeptidase regulatory-like domain-containing protein [Candidatus Aquilonibacter sp.]
MKYLAATLLILALLVPRCVTAQEMLTVAYDKTITLNVPGATSAYPVNPSIVAADVVAGAVAIRGVGTGVTNVVVLIAGGAVTTVAVTVTGAPPVQLDLGGATSRQSEGGSYTGTYNSEGGSVTNAFDLWQQQGQTFRQVLVTEATFLSPSAGQAGSGFPVLSYEISRPGQRIVFLDEVVTISPLTFNDALVRGFHIAEGPWTFHVGASSVGVFGSYFIPTNPQWMAGVTRAFKLSTSSTISANLYDIVNTPGLVSSTNGGVIGSLLYTYQPQPKFIVQAELGLSRSIGFDVSTVYDDTKQHGDASLVEKPATFASLATDAQQGLFGNADYSRTFSSAFNANATVSKTDYSLPTFREDSLTAQGNANYQLKGDFSTSAGVLYSSFDSIYPTVFNVRTLAIPLSIAYNGKHFVAGLQDQPTSDFQGTHANGYGANVGLNYPRFQISALYQHSVDIPTVSSLFNQVPGLQAALEQAGITITNPSQLAALLNNTALLASLGFTGLQLNVAPAQNNVGANINWLFPGKSRGQLSLSYLSSDAQLAQGAFDFRLATLTYLRRLNASTDMTASVTTLRSSEYSSATTTGQSAPSVSSQVSYGLTFSHRFSSVPAFLFPTRRGNIDGYVFRDDDSSGKFSTNTPVIGGVEVKLDGERSTRTDSAGHYAFAGVPYGSHQVEAEIPSTGSSYFTTDSPATAEIGSHVDFGVNSLQGKIIGNIVNDAGQGVGGVIVAIAGSKQSTTTGSDGRFVFEGIAPGHYVVSASPDSFPTGYDLSNLSTMPADVTNGVPKPLNLSVRALRSVSGTVTMFDPRRAKLAPAAGIEVSIPQLDIVSKTDSNGVYALRNLPPGTYTIVVGRGTSVQRRAIALPPDPTILTGIDFRVR